jgi:5'-nucleotidase
MLRLTLDMDDVMANTHEKLVDIVLNEFDTVYDLEDFSFKSLNELLHPKQLKRLSKIIRQPGFFVDVAVKKDAVETVYQLSQYYEVYVATAAMEFPNSFREKFDWLARHFDFIPWTNVVFCGDKSIIASDYLLDDHPRNLRAFRGEGVLFSSPHNLKETAFKRVSSWKEVAELFLPQL